MANSVMLTIEQVAELKEKSAEKNIASHTQVKNIQPVSMNETLSKKQTSQKQSNKKITLEIMAGEAQIKPEKNSILMVTLPIHVVIQSESLFTISKHYNIVMESLARWNKLRSPYLLKIGDVLYLSDPKSAIKR
jgi:type IV pilus assembly protein PilF